VVFDAHDSGPIIGGSGLQFTYIYIYRGGGAPRIVLLGVSQNGTQNASNETNEDEEPQ
jgi:hypothetical protein